MDLALQKPIGLAIKRKPGVVKMLFRDREEKKVISYRLEEGTNCGPEAISWRGEGSQTTE